MIVHFVNTNNIGRYVFCSTVDMVITTIIILVPVMLQEGVYMYPRGVLP